MADSCKGKHLPIPVSSWYDEFANAALPDSFCELLSTMRSREISCNIIVQNMAQIKHLFKDLTDTIPGNVDTMIYLGSSDPNTHKYFSELLGKYTLDKKSHGETREYQYAFYRKILSETA